MVRVVRTPLCIAEFLRDEEPFFIGMVTVPDTPTKPKEEKPPKTTVSEVVIPPLPKPARRVDVGDVLDQFEF